MGRFTLPRTVVVALLTLPSCIPGVIASASPYLIPGFQFNYDQPKQTLSIPVTSQCEQIHLKWTRDSNSTGPLPVAPYFLQVYSSASSVPYIIEAGFGPSFDWVVPFAPNTQYQICMFDINGVSGGCQQTYSVIANATVNNPTCQNVTAPPSLPVTATVPSGAMFQYSYIDQCTSLSVTPTSGSPPYTLTIAPDFHPPYNITSNSKDPIFWEVTLPVGFHFFLSLESADGLMWANGPMRVGGLGKNSCLVPGSVSKSFFQKTIAGTSIGGVVFGLIAAWVIQYVVCFLEHRRLGKAPSQSYLAAEYATNHSATKSLRSEPSSIALSSPRSGSALLPTILSTPLPSTPPSRSSELPLEQLRPLRPSVRRNRSSHPHNAVHETEPAPSRTQTNSDYPLDIKRPLPSPTPATSTFSRDDASSLASSSTNPARHRPLSIQSRAPTYVPRSTNLRGPVTITNESESVIDLPPEYGRHTTDTTLNYAPSVLSSGNRF